MNENNVFMLHNSSKKCESNVHALVINVASNMLSEFLDNSNWIPFPMYLSIELEIHAEPFFFDDPIAL